jgi:hypothetical protein
MTLFPLQEYLPTDWSGLTTENHIASIYGIDIQSASELITMLHQINFGMDLDTFLSQFPVKYFNTEDDFRWMLQGNSRKNIPLVRCEIDGTPITPADQVGLGGGEFTLVFNEDFFSDTDLIVGEKNERYSIQIKDVPEYVGTEVHYRCVLFTKDSNLFIPYTELVAGKRFSREWNPVERTLSVKGGHVNYTSPFSMINTFTMIRMQDVRPGNMIARPVAFSWQVESPGGGKETKSTWMQYADWEFEQQFKETKSRLLMFAVSNRNDDGTYSAKGKSGYDIKQGAGIRQQMESSNVAYYNTFDIKWMTTILLDLSVNRLTKDQRKFILRTGEWGMYQFSESLEDYSSLYTPLQVTERVYSGKNNTLGYKGQFLEFMGPNGVEVTLSHEPMNDDPTRNKIYHPKGGLAESYRYDILDIGTSNGEPNIQKCMVKGQEEIMVFIPGLRNPYTPDGKMSQAAHAVDGYEVHRATVLGSKVTDPTRCAAMIPNMLSDVGVVY